MAKQPTRDEMIDALAAKVDDWTLDELKDAADELVRKRLEKVSTKDLREAYQDECGECGCHDGILIMTGNDPIDVQRCDDCGIYDTDEAAAEALVRRLEGDEG